MIKFKAALKKFLYTNSFYTLDEYFDESCHVSMGTLINYDMH
jgi:hypothetical protein